MSPATTKSEKAGAAQRRRTVRIIKRRPLSRPAVLSLAVAGGAVVCALALWRFWHHVDVAPFHQRTLWEWETDWKCDADHTFNAEGQIEPRSCWTCGQPAYPVVFYRCAAHGTYEASARFTAHEDGRWKVAYLRLRGGAWVASEHGLLCPQCSRPLREARKDPLRPLGTHKATGGD